MNFNQLLKQAQQMQKKANKAKKEFNEKSFDFESQQGIIQGKINGNLQLTELHISQEYLNANNKELLEDLLILTINNILEDVEKQKEDTLNSVTNGVDVSSFL